VIIDLEEFIRKERGFWTELEQRLDALERDAGRKLDLERIKRLHYLYQRASAGLGRIMSFSCEPQTRTYLESLVARAYGELHAGGAHRPHRFAPLKWFFVTFPRTFRKHVRAFQFSLIVMLIGCLFGGLAVTLDPGAKEELMPFSHLLGDPSQRVRQEETDTHDRLKGQKAAFSSTLMTHNTKVSIFTMALGMTWGIGTVIMLFSNGVMLAAVAADYVHAGQTVFLLGWLLPHGVVEIPSILLAGQAGLVLAGALIGRGKSLSIKMRLKAVSKDIVTLMFGLAVMLIWAGFIEAFLSQYHEPVIPYHLKIGFGLSELAVLVLFFWKSGAKRKSQVTPEIAVLR
jgi:uncharacterized membrane protein SpoIIM required for sporulation